MDLYCSMAVVFSCLVDHGEDVLLDALAVVVPRRAVLPLVLRVLLAATEQKHEAGNDGQVVDQEVSLAGGGSWKMKKRLIKIEEKKE